MVKFRWWILVLMGVFTTFLVFNWGNFKITVHYDTCVPEATMPQASAPCIWIEPVSLSSRVWEGGRVGIFGLEVTLLLYKGQKW